MGIHEWSEANENVELLIDFCLNNNCVIRGMIFPHKKVHKLTWTSPDGHTVNQIDHIIIKNKWRRSLQDVCSFRGADARSDHYLVAASIKLKLRKTETQSQGRKHLDIAKLKSQDKRLCHRAEKAF